MKRLEGVNADSSSPDSLTLTLTATVRSLASFDAKTLLSQAIDNRPVHLVEYLIEKLKITKNSELTKTDLYDDGMKVTTDLSLNGLLYSSASHGFVSLVKILISRGADPREPSLASAYGGSILHGLASCTNIYSSEDEEVELAKLLVDKGADINFQEPDTKSTPIHNAVHYLKPKLVKEFLSRGANPLAKQTNGHTPYLNLLTDNYSWSSVDALESLVDGDPEILLRVFHFSDSRTNFYHVLSEAPEIARDDGISARMCTMLVSKLKNLRDGRKLLRAQLEQRQTFTGFMPLHSAVWTANEEVLKCILQEGGDVNAKVLGSTPMSLATSRDSWKRYIDMWRRADTQSDGPSKKPAQNLDLRTAAWNQCSRQEGWLKRQARTKRIVTLLKEYGGTESSPEEFLTALEEPFEMGSFFQGLGISGDALEEMMADLKASNEAEGVVLDGGMGVLEE